MYDTSLAQNEVNSEVKENKTKTEKKSVLLWGKELGARYTIMSDYFQKPKYRKKLGLTQTESEFITVVMSYKNDSNNPCVSYSRLADDMGYKYERKIMSIVKTLEKNKKMVNVTRKKLDNKNNEINRYDFSPLIKKLEAIVIAEQKERKKQFEQQNDQPTQLSDRDYHQTGEGGYHQTGDEGGYHQFGDTLKTYIYKDLYKDQPQTPYESKEQKTVSSKNNRLVGIDSYIKNNFSEEIQNMLFNVKEIADSNYFDLKFVRSFKKACNRANKSINENLLKDMILDTLDYMERKPITSLVRFLINKMENPKKYNSKKEIVPEWLTAEYTENNRKSVKDQIGETSYSSNEKTDEVEKVKFQISQELNTSFDYLSNKEQKQLLQEKGINQKEDDLSAEQLIKQYLAEKKAEKALKIS